MAAGDQGGAASPPVAPKTGGGGNGEGQGFGAEQIMGEEDSPILKRRIDLLHSTARESRLPDDYEFSFNPGSMVGSWFHRLENDEIVWQGVVVAEPQPGTYLVQIERLDVGAVNVQRLIPLERMVNDEDGYDWRFYDSQEDARSAYAHWNAVKAVRS
jgi:hypothetical protein